MVLDAGGLDNNLIVYLGAGGARFVAVPTLSVPPGAAAAAVGDWDGDGHQDLVTVSTTGDSICVLRALPK